MAAYAALMSLTHVIDQIKNHHRPPISLDKHQVESIAQKVTFFLEFLEVSNVSSKKEASALKSRITDAARAAEDVLETHVVDQILGGFSSRDGERMSSLNLHQDLQKVMEDMDSIKMEVKDLLIKKTMPKPLGSLGSSTGQISTMSMVGFKDVRIEIMDKLTGGRLDRQIIPIVGMGGIGKTTLARNVYASKLIKDYFDICAWTPISQEYNTHEILIQILSQDSKERKDKLINLNENELGETLHKSLWGRRYLIVLDDMWSIEVWDKISLFFPDNNNGSSVIITTRLSHLAYQITGSRTRSINLALLDEDNSWSLFCKLVFGGEGCPLELEEVGKKIAKSCRGLPLSIVVVGGLLAKDKHTRECWDYIGENLNAIVNLENDEHCLKILRLSYDELPVYLKQCFLYMGVFEEDRSIRVSSLVKLWVSEGFLKPVSGKSMETVGREFLNELVDRNLLIVDKIGCSGNVKVCKIHDLVRDLCLREAELERFCDVIRQKSPQLITSGYRIVIPQSTYKEKALKVLQSASCTRSLICDYAGFEYPINLRLLRILKAFDRDSYRRDKDFLGDVFQFVNLRYLAVRANRESDFPSSVYLLWNLQTIIVDPQFMKTFTAPLDIWNMPQLRHVEFPVGLNLPDVEVGLVMENLQTLKNVANFKCSEEMVKRIPNIKKLGVEYRNQEGVPLRFHRDNLHRLHQLESFQCSFTHYAPDSLHLLTFPLSLKKLTLEIRPLNHWDDDGVLEKVGLLPLLEKLSLVYGSFATGNWETTECHFPSLKVLKISECRNFHRWITESSHFPHLEHLVLYSLDCLEEIPSEIGEIPTLQSIELIGCTNSAAISTKKIVAEQEELYGEEVALRVLVKVRNNEEGRALESLACPNFQVESMYSNSIL